MARANLEAKRLFETEHLNSLFSLYRHGTSANSIGERFYVNADFHISDDSTESSKETSWYF